jgi:DNA-binding MarR family transcriptional regulator
MDDETARKLWALTTDLMMVFGRMKRFAHVGDPGSVHPGTEFAILDTILRHGCRTVPEIAISRGVTRQSVQKVVNKLLDVQTLVYIENPSHKSSKYLQVTPGGLKMYQDVKANMVGLYLRAEDGLRKGDVEAAARVMAVIADTWDLKEQEADLTVEPA